MQQTTGLSVDWVLEKLTAREKRALTYLFPLTGNFTTKGEFGPGVWGTATQATFDQYGLIEHGIGKHKMPGVRLSAFGEQCAQRLSEVR